MDINTVLQSKHFEDVGTSKCLPGSPCVVTFKNRSGNGATITSFGARFWFQDSNGNVTDDQIVPGEGPIADGAEGSVSSKDCCVRKVLYGYTIDSDPQPRTGSTQGDATSCLQSFTVTATP